MTEKQLHHNIPNDILIVDDEIPNLQLLSELLGEEGYQVRPANKPQLAIDSAISKPPMLILLDVKMPEMDGFEVCRLLKQNERTCNVPIIFISALHEVEDKIRGFEVGGTDFITKPFAEEEVLARVRTHIELRNMQLNLEAIVAKRSKDLAKSEAKYRGLVDNSLVGVFNSTYDGRYKFINEAMVRMFDFDAPEQMFAQGSNKRWKNLKDRDLMLTELQQRGEVVNFEAEVISRTKRTINVILSAKLVGENIFGMVMDISQRKQAETKLVEAHTKIKKLQQQILAESAYLQDEIKLEHNFGNIIGRSEALKYVLSRVEQVAPQESTVLIQGETGTGKELFARALHELSPRGKRPLVKVNCAALPSELIESEMFGRQRGAYTGATDSQIGRFELANGSTLFLDEIGEIPLALQAKLLHVFESGEFERLGSSKTLKSNVRIIAATNRDLEDEVRNNRFRQDLLYRLNIFPISIPPLRDRTDDIPLLVNSFIHHFGRKMGKSDTFVISKKSIQKLQSYTWPGNVRELKHVIESAMISVHGNQLHFDIPQTADVETGDLKSFEEMEREYILKVLDHVKWKVGGENSASIILGTPASTLRSRMKKLGIQRP